MYVLKKKKLFAEIYF